MRKPSPLFYLPSLRNQMFYGSAEGVRTYYLVKATPETLSNMLTKFKELKPNHVRVLCLHSKVVADFTRADNPLLKYVDTNQKRGVVLTGYIGTAFGLPLFSDIYMDSSMRFLSDDHEAAFVEFDPNYLDGTVRTNSIRDRTNIYLDSLGINVEAVRSSFHLTAQKFAE